MPILGPLADSVRAAPYSTLASSYDRMVGWILAPAIRTSFEQALSAFGLRFGSAADIGCGTGVFLRYLLRYPVPLWGVDVSVPMLRVAARRLPPCRVRLLRQDIRRLRLPRPVDLITCNGDTLNYLLTPKDLARALGRCRESLAPRGHLLGDLLTGTPPVASPGWRVLHPGPDTITLWRARADPRSRITRVELRSRQGLGDAAPWVQETHVQRWHRLSELHQALRAAGLVLRAHWELQRAEGIDDGAWIKFLACRLEH